MKHVSFQKFIDLVTFDKKYHELKDQVKSAQAAIEEAQDQRKVYENKVEVAAIKKDEAHKIVKDNELEIKTLEEKEDHEKKVLAGVKNMKEQRAAQAELEAVQYKRNEIEQNLARLWNRYEVLEEENKAISEEGKIAVAKVEEEIKKNENIISEAEKELAQYSLERVKKREGISEEWLEMYEMMKGRAKDPVVPVIQESCSVCFYMVSSQDLQKLQQDALLQCKDCYRLLYIPDEKEPEEVVEESTEVE